MSKYYKAEDVDLVCIKNFANGDVLSAIRSLPTIETSEDDLYIPLNNQTVERINRLHKDECGEYFDEEWLFNELEQISEFREVSEDCISRVDLIKSFLADNECKREEAKACMCSLDLMLELIEDAPSVVSTTEQSSKVGEWIKQGISPHEGIQICSVCGAMYDITAEFDNCPNCHAKMKGAEE